MTGSRMAKLVSLYNSAVGLYHPGSTDDMMLIMSTAAIAWKCETAFIGQEVELDALVRLILADQANITKERSDTLAQEIRMIVRNAEAFDQHLRNCEVVQTHCMAVA